MTEKMLEENMKEIQRRKQVDDSDHSFEKTGTCNLPLKIPDQNFVLFSTSHVEMAPFCSDPDEPSIKFYGIFPDVDSAKSYCEECNIKNVNIQIHPIQEWGVLAYKPDHLQNPTYIANKISSIVQSYVDERASHNDNFNENKSKQQTGDDVIEETRKVSESVRFEHKSTLREKKKISGVGNISPVYGQKYMVVSFLPDKKYERYPELLFAVHGAFDTEQEADSWIRHVLSEKVTDVDIDIVNSCQWLFPQNIKSSDFGTEKFRGSELNKVMQYHKSEPSKIKQFKEWNESTSSGEQSTSNLKNISSENETQVPGENETQVPGENETETTSIYELD